MDKHLLIPLLQNLKEQNDSKGHFDKKDLLRAQMDVISKTKMVEYEMEFYTELTGKTEMPAEMAARRDKVLTDWAEFSGNCGNLIAIVDGGPLAPSPRASPFPPRRTCSSSQRPVLTCPRTWCDVHR